MVTPERWYVVFWVGVGVVAELPIVYLLWQIWRAVKGSGDAGL